MLLAFAVVVAGRATSGHYALVAADDQQRRTWSDVVGSYDTVWVFHGGEGRLASGVFRTEAEARLWLAAHRLSGILTEYPVGDGCYDVAVREGIVEPTRDHHGTPKHVATFSPGFTPHFHFVDGSD